MSINQAIRSNAEWTNNKYMMCKQQVYTVPRLLTLV